MQHVEDQAPAEPWIADLLTHTVGVEGVVPATTDEGEEPSYAGAGSSSGKGEGQPSAPKGEASGKGDYGYQAAAATTEHSQSFSSAAADWSGTEWSSWVAPKKWWSKGGEHWHDEAWHAEPWYSKKCW